MNIQAHGRSAGRCIVTALLFTGACRAPDRLTPDNYSRIAQLASTQSEVSALIGEPTNRLGERWLYERPQQHLFVFVDFDDQGRVVRKQWIDATTGQWEDTQPNGPSPTVRTETSFRSENANK